MTGKTIRWGALVYTVRMAPFTICVRMGANQWEIGPAMIECGILPPGRIMTRRADGTKLPVMCIVQSMAGHTFPGRSFIGAVLMTGSAGHAGM